MILKYKKAENEGNDRSDLMILRMGNCSKDDIHTYLLIINGNIEFIWDLQ